VDERYGKFINDLSDPSVQKEIYFVDLSGATDISDPANGAVSRSAAGPWSK
jgi:hypothetical protein